MIFLKNFNNSNVRDMMTIDSTHKWWCKNIILPFFLSKFLLYVIWIYKLKWMVGKDITFTCKLYIFCIFIQQKVYQTCRCFICLYYLDDRESFYYCPKNAYFSKYWTICNGLGIQRLFVNMMQKKINTGPFEY